MISELAQKETAVPELFVARQPIFLADRKLAAYELLFRSSAANVFPAGVDPDKASIDIIAHAIGLFGLDTLVGPHLHAYINVTRRVMLEALYDCLPQGRFVLELLENLHPDAELLAACVAAKQAGYGLALDDYADQPGLAGFLPHVDVVKVDFRVASIDTRRLIAERFAGTGMRLLAEKIESEAELKEASQLGYTHFQGFFFCKPEMVRRQDVPVSKLVYLQFLSELNRPNLDFARMERVIKQDVALSLKLLRYLKNAAFGWRTDITSIKHALSLLGERPFRRWASVLALAVLSSDRPAELLTLSLTRARFCELLGPEIGMSARSLDLFLVGLFSLMDAVMQRPLSELLGEVSLSKELVEALTPGIEENRMRQALDLAVAYERANWIKVDRACTQLGALPARLPKIYSDALSWASDAAKAG
jgi:EAL and modified HD-GYP domain-containing signal transduction protein